MWTFAAIEPTPQNPRVVKLGVGTCVRCVIKHKRCDHPPILLDIDAARRSRRPYRRATMTAADIEDFDDTGPRHTDPVYAPGTPGPDENGLTNWSDSALGSGSSSDGIDLGTEDDWSGKELPDQNEYYLNRRSSGHHPLDSIDNPYPDNDRQVGRRDQMFCSLS